MGAYFLSGLYLLTNLAWATLWKLSHHDKVAVHRERIFMLHSFQVSLSRLLYVFVGSVN